MTPREEAERWLRQAKADMSSARKNFEIAEYSTASFLAQQSAEKAIKALLYARDQRVLGHSIVGLLSKAVSLGYPAIDSEAQEAAEGLDEHYISTRYPDAFENRFPSEHYTAGIAEEALEWASWILKYATDNLA